MTRSDEFFDRAFGETPLIRLTDADPDLFARLPPDGLRDARSLAVARALRLGVGRWRAPTELRGGDGSLGLLVVEGLILRTVRVAQHDRSEIIGPGDIVRPWQRDEGTASVPVDARWDVVARARMAVLDARMLAFVSRWPQMTLSLFERTVRRAHWLTLQLAIADVRRVDERLLLFFWHLADRWGRVNPNGVHVPLPVTHDVLAQLVCAQRPTVTSALRRLNEQDLIHRQHDKTWLLVPAQSPSLRVPSMA
jgi:hypothetical protein